MRVTTSNLTLERIDAPAGARPRKAQAIKSTTIIATSFGGCKMCGCRSYQGPDWQWCKCGHSRSQHQH